MNIQKKLIGMLFFIIAGFVQLDAAAPLDKENVSRLNGGAGRLITNVDMDLSSAAHYGKLQAVQESLKKGANPNMRIGNYTLFEDTFDLAFPAAKNSQIIEFKPNQVEILKELARHGGNIKDLHLDEIEVHYFDKTGKPIKALFSSEAVATEYRKTIDFLKGLRR